MSLNVLNVSYPFAPVGPDSVGGAEQVLHMIDAALAASGHRSVVIAPRQSRVAGELVPFSGWQGRSDDHAKQTVYSRYSQIISRAIREYSIDVVHLHGVDFINYLGDWDVPAIATLHLPLDWYDRRIFELWHPGLVLNCVSRIQLADCRSGAPDLPVIENGIAVDELPLIIPKQDYALALGRICPEKGYHLALEAAGRSGAELLLAGEVFPYEAHQQYFHREIIPRLDARRRFVGPLGWERKRTVLSAARCLLAPSLAPETSSLVAMEALACGTPVIAFPSGALRDIVEDGITGFLVDSVEQMARAIAAAPSIDPEVCRARARARFSSRRMTAEYLKLYDQMAGLDSRASRRALSSSRKPRRSISVLSTWDQVQELIPDWLDLWRRHGSTPFQSPQWLLSWWKQFQGSGRLHVGALFLDRSLAAVLPLWFTAAQDGVAPQMLLIGSGVSDSLDALYDPEAKEAGADFAGELLSLAPPWEVCDLQELPRESPLLNAGLPDEFESRVITQSVSPALKLGSDLESSIPAPMLRRLRYYRRRLARKAAVQIRASSATNFEECFARLIGLHQARWNARGQSGALSDPAVARFHREASRLLMDEGALRLYSLDVDGSAGAAFYGYQWRGRTFYYLGGFDPRFSELNLGTLMVGYAIEQAIAERSREFCFLRGNEAYKYAWGARDGITYRRIIRKTSQPETRGTPAYDSGA